jgi:hypothetical protein
LHADSLAVQPMFPAGLLPPSDLKFNYAASRKAVATAHLKRATGTQHGG